ncbi:hypothetical protein FOMPIDRAFT_1048286 [Fomitopsis schrenkii]|uniref:Uncharacterized protein n=1 Tax=Fomitopsis schrenkii TaxID=2126942 RepID=S8EFK1_FOMSC|nr:hypothetical protein FOMPIDRAFT_1048286 [Fomitopsis schrenkii]
MRSTVRLGGLAAAALQRAEHPQANLTDELLSGGEDTVLNSQAELAEGPLDRCSRECAHMLEKSVLGHEIAFVRLHDAFDAFYPLRPDVPEPGGDCVQAVRMHS